METEGVVDGIEGGVGVHVERLGNPEVGSVGRPGNPEVGSTGALVGLTGAVVVAMEVVGLTGAVVAVAGTTGAVVAVAGIEVATLATICTEAPAEAEDPPPLALAELETVPAAVPEGTRTLIVTKP